jgi:phosphate transport system substrate-binding protein
MNISKKPSSSSRKTIAAILALLTSFVLLAAKWIDHQSRSIDVPIEIEVRDQATRKAISNATVHVVGVQANTDGSGIVHFRVAQDKLLGARALAGANCYEDNSANLTAEQKAPLVIELPPRKGCLADRAPVVLPAVGTSQTVRSPREAGSMSYHLPAKALHPIAPQATQEPTPDASLVNVNTRIPVPAISNKDNSASSVIGGVLLKFDTAPPILQKWQQYLKTCLQHSGFYLTDSEHDADFVLDCPGCSTQDDSFTVSFSNRKTHSQRPYLVQKTRSDDGDQEIEPNEALDICSDIRRALPASAQEAAKHRLTGAGSTFAAPLYQTWSFQFGLQFPTFRLTYESVGSENGVAFLRDGFVTFSASDVPLNPNQLQSLNTAVMQIPVAAGAVAIAYNIDGLTSTLRFTPETLAKIFSGQIKKWSDKAIAAENPGVALPPLDITVVHREDGSGTTFVFSRFLADASPIWKGGIGLRVKWSGGQPAKGNGGVAKAIKTISGSIGYVEYTYAVKHNLLYASIKNRAGRWVQPEPGSISAAVPDQDRFPEEPNQLTELLLKADNESAYAISSLTFLIFPVHQPEHDSREALRAFLTWMLSSGQDSCVGLKYGRLPQHLAERQLQEVSEILR